MGGGGGPVSRVAVSGGGREGGTRGGRVELSRQFCDEGFPIWRVEGLRGGVGSFLRLLASEEGGGGVLEVGGGGSDVLRQLVGVGVPLCEAVSGGGGDLSLHGVGGGGGSGFSTPREGLVEAEASSIPGLGVVCWVDEERKTSGMLRRKGGSFLLLTWELLVCTLGLHRLSNFCCSSCILLIFWFLDGVGVVTALICVGFIILSASRALAGRNSTKVGVLSALKAGLHSA